MLASNSQSPESLVQATMILDEDDSHEASNESANNLSNHYEMHNDEPFSPMNGDSNSINLNIIKEEFIDGDIRMSDGSGGNSISTRHEKSLGLLTTRFVSLLQDAKNGVLDLKMVCLFYLLYSL